MDPWAIIENVAIPNTGPLVLSVFFYHSYGDRFIMNVNFRIRIAEQPDVLTRDYMSKVEPVYDEKWTGSGVSRGEHIREQVVDYLKVPELYRGKKVAVHICLSAEEGSSK